MAQGLKPLADKLADKVGITKAAAYDFTRAFVGVLKDTLIEGETVTIQEFGVFSVKQIAPTMRRNPITGENFMADASARVRFKVSPVFRKAVVK